MTRYSRISIRVHSRVLCKDSRLYRTISSVNSIIDDRLIYGSTCSPSLSIAVRLSTTTMYTEVIRGHCQRQHIPRTIPASRFGILGVWNTVNHSTA